jgi:acetyl-CoA acetyltransferase family protein
MMVGGVESMSNMPFIYRPEVVAAFMRIKGAKTLPQRLAAFWKMPWGSLLNPIVAIQEGLTDPFCGMNMGQTADLLAKEFGITREEQDKFTIESHRKAVTAQENGKLAEEIVPVGVPNDYRAIVKNDVGPRKGQSMEQLAKLKPFFDRVNGTVTVGNACSITDGAVMLALMSEEKAKQAGYKILGKIKSVAFTGHEPERMGLGPVYASHAALKKAGLSFQQMDVLEINEAFAAQVLAVSKAAASRQWCKDKLGIDQALGDVDPAKLNPNGGAIALGHPVGSSGARIVLTALKELKRNGKQYALSTLCIGGGQGGAVVVERGA